MTVYDIAGRKVLAMPMRLLPAGHHAVQLNGDRLISGRYVYEIVSEDFVERKSMVLLK